MSKTKYYSTKQLQHAFKAGEPKNQTETSLQSTETGQGQAERFDHSALEEIRVALFHIPADDYQNWVMMGMALKTHLGERGFSLWDDWSKTAPEKYRVGEHYKKWCSFHRSDLKIASLFYLAKEFGWKPENNSKQSFASDRAQPHQDNNNEWPKLTPEAEKIRPAYPVDALPPSLLLVVEEVNGYVQAPVSMAATCAIMAIATVAQGLADIRRDKQLKSGVSLYSLIVAASGERKSFLDGIFTKPILKFEDQKKKEAEPKIKQYEAKLSAWKAKKRGLEAAITRAAKEEESTQELEQSLVSLMEEQPKPPKIITFYFTDITTEDLAFQQAMVWPSACINSAEGGAYFGGISMNKDNQTKAMAYANALWSGERYKVNRRTTDSFEVNGARLSIGLQVQSEPLQDFMQKHGAVFRGIGFLARFLFQYPETTQGTRFYKTPPDNSPAYTAFYERITELLKMPVTVKPSGGIQADELSLSPEAFEQWKQFYNETEAMITAGGALEDISDIVSKIAENVARLACLFHVYEVGIVGTVSKQHVENAARIMQWHLTEVQTYLSDQAQPKEVQNAQKLKKWMISYCTKNQCDYISPRTLSQKAPNALRKKQIRDETIAALIEAGIARLSSVKGKQVLQLHPDLLPKTKA